METVPINPAYEDDVQRAVAKVKTGAVVTASQLTEWMRSPCPELEAIAFRCLIERETQCEPYPEEEKVAFIVGFLRKSILEDCHNDFRTRRFDALLDCCALLGRECKTKVTPLARGIARMLAEICSKSDHTIREQVVDVVLEHVLQKETGRECFSFWRSSKGLDALYREGVDLAEKWQNGRRATLE